MARVRTEVCSIRRSRSSSASSNSPPDRASASPAGVRSTSTQPVNRLSAFHVDWPWRSSTRSSTVRWYASPRAGPAKPLELRHGDRPQVPRPSRRRSRPEVSAPKRVVVWGTGFVGKMVIPEILRHARCELVGVGVSNPGKAVVDAGEICGIGPIGAIGLTATDDTEALIAVRPDALVHYGPTAARADDNIRDIGAFLRAGIDVCSTAMTPWVWPEMKLNPPSWVDPISEACEAGGSSCFTTGIDPGFANDLLPLTLVGLCSEVRQVRA